MADDRTCLMACGCGYEHRLEVGGGNIEGHASLKNPVEDNLLEVFFVSNKFQLGALIRSAIGQWVFDDRLDHSSNIGLLALVCRHFMAVLAVKVHGAPSRAKWWRV